MTADVIYIALYCYKSLFLTSVLYLVFLAMCIAGYYRWKKSVALRVRDTAQEMPAL